MKKIICFGELLLRMNPSLNGEWIKKSLMPVYIGGAELNVARALANWNVAVKYCTALPKNYLSAEIVEYLSNDRIDTSAIQYSGSRIGIYYLPQGSDLKSSGVIYDRALSSFAELSPGFIHWEEVFKDCDWFHFSAISPSLNKNAAAVCKEALYYAAQKKMTISIDLNFRPSLWQFDKKPIQVMPELVNYCHVVMGNLWAAESLLGLPLDPAIHTKKSKTAYVDHAKQTSERIFDKFPACKTVANTFRFDEGNGIRYYATLDDHGGQYISPEFSIDKVIDKVGSGDCFMAGLIYGINQQLSQQEIINYAAAAAVGKIQEQGDATVQTIESIKRILSRA